MREEWRPVVGFEGLYEVSDMGNVRSVERQIRVLGRWGGEEVRTYRSKILRPHRAKDDYLRVGLCLHGERVTRTIHSLVAEAFLGPRPEGQEVRHLDCKGYRNCLENLAYGTRVTNREDSRREGTLAVGEKIAQSKLTACQILAIREADGLQRDIADAFGVSRSQIGRIKRGDNWVHV